MCNFCINYFAFSTTEIIHWLNDYNKTQTFSLQGYIVISHTVVPTERPTFFLQDVITFFFFKKNTLYAYILFQIIATS